MSEAEKQEGQKTVVAFIAGLLIGGLLVWVFSSSPAQSPVGNEAADDDTEVSTGTDSDADETATGSTDESDDDRPATSPVTTTTTEKPEPTTDVVRDGSIVVSDQKAGSVVKIDSRTFPTVAGWLVVRDYENNTAGRILGASRYNENEGLTPSQVNLVRSTAAGNTYQVVFYNDNGDKKFSVAEDAEIAEFSDTFKAE